MVLDLVDLFIGPRWYLRLRLRQEQGSTVGDQVYWQNLG